MSSEQVEEITDNQDNIIKKLDDILKDTLYLKIV